MKLYFAHNFNNRKEFRELELQLEEELGIELFNPFYDDPARKEEMAELDKENADASKRIEQLKQKAFVNKYNETIDDSRRVVDRDLGNLIKCDGLFTIIESPSFGTAIEICNAVMMRKPVYIVSQKYSHHPWLRIYATKIFETVEDFKKFVKKEVKNESL